MAPSRRASVLVGGVLVLALVVALVAAGVALVGLRADRDEQRDLVAAEAAAEEAARAAVVEMTTYDHTTVEEDFAWVDEAGTEAFQGYFSEVSADVVALIERVGASATGTVVASAATLEDATHVRVLLFVDQEITSTSEEGARLDQPRVTMEMVLEDGRWLVDEVAVNDLLAR